MHWQIGDAPLDGPPLAAAIGNFDGVHRGHQKLVMAACEAAKRDGLMPAIITFNPHPRDFFRREAAPFRLADNAEKDRLLSGLHVERIIHVSFDDALRRTDAEDFVSSVLPAIGVKQLFAGADFAFGRGHAQRQNQHRRRAVLHQWLAAPMRQSLPRQCGATHRQMTHE